MLLLDCCGLLCFGRSAGSSVRNRTMFLSCCDIQSQGHTHWDNRQARSMPEHVAVNVPFAKNLSAFSCWRRLVEMKEPEPGTQTGRAERPRRATGPLQTGRGGARGRGKNTNGGCQHGAGAWLGGGRAGAGGGVGGYNTEWVSRWALGFSGASGWVGRGEVCGHPRTPS
jgi:hypothetical protein